MPAMSFRRKVNLNSCTKITKKVDFILFKLITLIIFRLQYCVCFVFVSIYTLFEENKIFNFCHLKKKEYF